jgi:zinc/manganese transport system permease protein
MTLMDTQLTILGPALLAGALVLAIHVPLGREVLSRGIIFIDLAVAQVAGIGVILAHTLGWEPHGWQVQPWALGAALLAALFLHTMERRGPEVLEALIGALFVTAASAGLLLLAHNPHGGEHLAELLAGQILWVTPRSLIPVAVLYLALLIVWFGFRHRLGRFGFYGVFALAVTASVQLVGVYLVFASLILPALAATGGSPRRGLAVAYVVGAVGYTAGLALSALADLPAGPAVVCTLAAVAGTILLVRRLPSPGVEPEEASPCSVSETKG